MPVSFLVATHPAKPYPFAKGTGGYTADETLAMACADQHTKAGEIFQFSLPVESDTNSSSRNIGVKIPNLIPNQNGFVSTLLDAYTQDRALVIRPDDVWLAILSQFNFFVNARAELLRANFVAHEGPRELIVTAMPATRYSVDFGELARQMAGLVEKNVVDPTLRAWATPDFTTTTPNDTTSDWVNILGRLEKLKEYGLETTAWYHLLRPVITRFVAAFDDPTSPANVDFWQRIAHYHPGGSGRVANTPAHRYRDRKDKELILDGTPYHAIGRKRIPPGYGEVDVTLDDNGEVFACAMVAGSVGMRVSSSHDVRLSSSGKDDTVRPVAGWWLFVKEEERMEARAQKAYKKLHGVAPFP
ncbi:hypothetical protein B0H13DRAFT_2249519 [Mycena leptocephala]|nr:hypothetical protein B0H13DRAFT_2249519 [Mycena leptocephala]